MIGSINFTVSIRRYCIEVCANNFFPRTMSIWNSLPVDCYPLIIHLSYFKGNVSRHLISLRPTLIFNCLCFLSLCNPMPVSGCLELCRVKPIRKYCCLYCVFVLGYMLNGQIISTYQNLFLVHLLLSLLLLLHSCPHIYLKNNSFQASVLFPYP